MIKAVNVIILDILVMLLPSFLEFSYVVLSIKGTLAASDNLNHPLFITSFQRAPGLGWER